MSDEMLVQVDTISAPSIFLFPSVASLHFFHFPPK